MEQYKKEIADNPDVELIHISCDQSEAAAADWAAKNEFPWLTVLPADAKRSGLLDYRTRNSVPHYSLRSADGEELANGSADVFDKLDDLD